jgi:hypothetical protein
MYLKANIITVYLILMQFNPIKYTSNCIITFRLLKIVVVKNKTNFILF